MSKPDMMMHLRTLPLLRTLSIEDREVVRWAIGEIGRLSLADAERIAVEAAERCLRWQAAVEAESEARDGRPPQKSVERARFADALLAMRERLAKGGET